MGAVRRYASCSTSSLTCANLRAPAAGVSRLPRTSIRRTSDQPLRISPQTINRHAPATSAPNLDAGPPVDALSRAHSFENSSVHMTMPFEPAANPSDPRAVQILAKTIYRELRATGFSSGDVMGLAGELLALVTAEVRSQSAASTR